MKLNFWQWVGVVILLLATPIWVYNKMGERKAHQMSKPPANILRYPEDESTTNPATEPSAGPTTAPATAPA